MLEFKVKKYAEKGACAELNWDDRKDKCVFREVLWVQQQVLSTEDPTTFDWVHMMKTHFVQATWVAAKDAGTYFPINFMGSVDVEGNPVSLFKWYIAEHPQNVKQILHPFTREL